MDLDQHIEQGNEYVDSKKFKEAIRCYDEALKIDPNCVWAHHWKILSLLYLEKVELAKKCIDLAINVKPEDYDYEEFSNILSLKAIITDEKKIEEKIQYYDKAIKFNSKNKIALVNKGTILFDMEEYDDAIKYFDRVLKIDPKNFDVLVDKGKALAYLEKLPQSITCLKKALKIESNDKDLAKTILGLQKILNQNKTRERNEKKLSELESLISNKKYELSNAGPYFRTSPDFLNEFESINLPLKSLLMDAIKLSYKLYDEPKKEHVRLYHKVTNNLEKIRNTRLKIVQNQYRRSNRNRYETTNEDRIGRFYDSNSTSISTSISTAKADLDRRTRNFLRVGTNDYRVERKDGTIGDRRRGKRGLTPTKSRQIVRKVFAGYRRKGYKSYLRSALGNPKPPSRQSLWDKSNS